MSIIGLMGAALAEELRSRGVPLDHTACEDIVEAVVTQTAALARTCVTAGTAPPQPASPTTTWEYRVIALAADQIGATQDRLNALGRDGWEIAAVVAALINHEIVLKRMIGPKVST
jgi:hypothetical protein